MQISKHMPRLDGFRGVAISLVLLWHFVVIPAAPAEGSVLSFIRMSLILSRSGVDMFFTLSGFLIGGVLLDARESPAFLKTFYLRRACRILPLYLVVLLAFHAARAIFGTDSALLATEVPLWSFWTMTQNMLMSIKNTYGGPWLAVSWSLALEEQFYLFFPLIIYFMTPGRLPRFLIGCIVLAPILRLLAFYSFPLNGEFIGYTWLPTRADALAIGALLAWAWRDNAVKERLMQAEAKSRNVFRLMLVPLAALAYAVYLNTGWHMATWGHTFLTFFYGLALLVTLQSIELERKSWLDGRVIRKTGELCYGLYLLHPIVLALLMGAPHQITRFRHILGTIGTLAATFILAEISWRWLEKPITHKGRSRFRYS